MIIKFNLFETFNVESIQNHSIEINSGDDAFYVTDVLLKLGFFPYSKTPDAARNNYIRQKMGSRHKYYKYYEPYNNYNEYQMSQITKISNN